MIQRWSRAQGLRRLVAMERDGRKSHGGGDVRDLAGGTVDEQADRPSWRRQSRHDLGSATRVTNRGDWA